MVCSATVVYYSSLWLFLAYLFIFIGYEAFANLRKTNVDIQEVDGFYKETVALDENKY